MSPTDRLAQLTTHLTTPSSLLANQTAIITGSGQGIGAATAHLFASAGARVIVSDIDSSKSDSTAAEINALYPGRALSVPGDVLDPAYPGVLIAKAAQHGNGKIHIIVNNAGYTWDGVVHKISDAQWSTMLEVHCTAPFRIIRAAAPYFRVADGERRCIVNVSSTSGTHGNAGQANYSVAKAGVVGLTKTVAKEWGPKFGVRANTIAFGYIETRLTAAKEEGAFMVTRSGERVALGIPGKQLGERKGEGSGDVVYKDIPLGRPGTASEAAGAILAVVSPLMAYVNGQTIEVTGGRNI